MASFTRSNIRIFASIAIPTERMSHAIEASVKTTENIFTNAKSSITYKKSVTPAKNPAILYTITKNTNIITNPTIPAIIRCLRESVHKRESIVLSEVR